jgi:hypothetical protein
MQEIVRALTLPPFLKLHSPRLAGGKTAPPDKPYVSIKRCRAFV